jgi:hypothetical protein
MARNVFKQLIEYFDQIGDSIDINFNIQNLQKFSNG